MKAGQRLVTMACPQCGVRVMMDPRNQGEAMRKHRAVFHKQPRMGKGRARRYHASSDMGPRT